eukprot:5134311-Alexandrium_andersonii.AAC.1
MHVYFTPVPEEERHMEDVGPAEALPSSWGTYKMAFLKPKRWVDGIGLRAACEVLRVSVCVI